MDNKQLKKLRRKIAISHRKCDDGNLFRYEFWKDGENWYTTSDEERYIYKMVNCYSSLYRYDEIFTRKRYYTETMMPYIFVRSNHSEYNFKIHIINLEELCQEAFKPSRVMYRLINYPDYED